MTLEFDRHIPATDVVGQSRIPRRTLYTGDTMPAIGFGTFGNDRNGPAAVAQAAYKAMRVGYRLIDCAAAYRNEPELGQAIAAAMKEDIPREELYITSKLWNDKHDPKDVLPTLQKTLADLQVDYLDGYYIHWPFAHGHALGAGKYDRAPDGGPYVHEAYMKTYRELEKAVDLGLIRAIGTSNMTEKKLGPVLAEARIRPAYNQMEMHPNFSQPAFFEYLQAQNMLAVAYAPLGSPTRPERDTEADDIVVVEDPVIREIAQLHRVHPAIICIKWAVQRGQVPIPSSVVYAEYLSNLRCFTEHPLTEAEMAALNGVNRNFRLLKGMVFLWEGANSWKTIWDEE